MGARGDFNKKRKKTSFTEAETSDVMSMTAKFFNMNNCSEDFKRKVKPALLSNGYEEINGKMIIK